LLKKINAFCMAIAHFACLAKDEFSENCC
jgi:hypothetical protein